MRIIPAARQRSFARTWLALLLCAVLPAQLLADDKPASPPKGQRVLICGHSFHVFVGGPLATIAAAAGIKDHVNLGVQSIGGSTVTQHWNLAEDKNKVKTGLAAGTIDVLTLAPHMKLIPDKAIEDFAVMAAAKNPNVRILAQESWMVFDDMKAPIKANAERDKKTIEQLRASAAEFKAGLEKQAKEVNAKLGKQVVFVVPVADAVIALREKVIAGAAPGIAKQSDLFTDPIGHVNEPIKRLEAYCYFAAIYQLSPVGLNAFEKSGKAVSPELDRLLQEIAWKTVSESEMSGVKKSAAAK